jgi:hypothetical protein
MESANAISHAIVIREIALSDVSSRSVVFRSFTLFRTFSFLLAEKTAPPAFVKRPVKGRG